MDFCVYIGAGPLFDFWGPMQITTRGSKTFDIQNTCNGPSDVVEKKNFHFITYNLNPSHRRSALPVSGAAKKIITQILS